MLEHAALADARSLIRPIELDRHLRLDLLVEADLEAIEVEDVTAHGVMLLLLDHDGHRLGAVQLEIEQGVPCESSTRSCRAGT